MSELTANLATSKSINGAVFMVAAGLSFALVNIAVQGATMTLGVPSTSVAFWQYLFALAFCLPWLWRAGVGSLRTTQPGLHLLRVAFAAGGVQLWVYGLTFVPIWQAIALIMTSPFFVIAGAGLVLREGVTWQRIAATVVGFAGAMIILAPGTDLFVVEALLPLGAAMLWAGASLVTKHLTANEKPESVTFYLLVLLTPINLALALGGGFTIPTDTTMFLLLGAGFLTALAQYFLVRAYAAADASYLQPFDHVKLPLNIAAGWLVFSFAPSGNYWFGAALIVAASLALVRLEKR